MSAFEPKSNPVEHPRVFDLSRIGAGLPFSGVVDQLETLADGDLVVQAPPGTGKTTLVPPAVANMVPGRVIVTAPRRVAVRSAARRLAQLSGTRLGDLVGFTIRGESQVSVQTKVEFVTPGVLLRRLLRDGDVHADAVLLDEVHERNLDTDLALAMLHDLRSIRDDLRVVAMSATVDAHRFAKLLDARVVAAEAPIHPIDISYKSGPTRLDARGVTNEFLAHVAAQVSQPGTLVFLPGVGEVRRCAEMIQSRVSQHPVLQLHGQQSSKEQDAVFAKGDRIIVSTSLAESSVTVPGIRHVVDACLSRGPKLDVARGMTGLVTQSCAKASANQRAGRAGREGPGTVVRCVTATEFQSFPEWPAPEIEVADLTQALLDAAAWGTPGFSGLQLLDEPPASHINAAMTTLERLGAITSSGNITELGTRLATLPLHPRLGRALLVAAEYLPKEPLADAVAELSGVERKRLLRILDETDETHFAGQRDNSGATSALALVTALAWPDFIGKKRGDEYLFTGGTAATYKSDAQWIAASEVSRTSRGAVVRQAVPISKETATFAHVTRGRRKVCIDGSNTPKVTARQQELLGAIELKSVPVQPTPSECREAWTHWLKDHELPMDSALVARMNLLHEVLGAPWPAVTTKAMMPLLDLGTSTLPTSDARLLLPWPEASRFDELVPERITMPSGRSFKVDYGVEPPVLAVKLQECFGLTETPALVDGRVPLMLHLLSPAGRPLAVTQDLVSFFAGPYQQVRSEMRGRYPKHAWPDSIHLSDK